MSGNPSTQTTLTNANHFEFDAELEDPGTGLTFTVSLEVDTGCPVALALPKLYHQFFTEYQGDINLGGAGSKNSPTFNANIRDVGGVQVDFDTMAVMTLDNQSSYGLLGINFLKFAKTEIFDSPGQKTLKLTDTHF